jgi:topoisomerase-4 subunit A
MKKTSFEFDFSAIAIKGRTSQGNILTKHPIKQIVKKEEGISTLKARDLWYDESVQRLNAEERGIHLGAFEGEDRIMTIQRSGTIKLYNFDLSTHFDEDMILILKHDPRLVVSCVYYDGNTQSFYLKRFNVEAGEKLINILNEHKESRLAEISLDWLPRLEVSFEEKNGRKREDLEIDVAAFIGVKSYRAKGKRLSEYPIEKIRWLEPFPYELPPEPGIEEIPEGSAEDLSAEGDETAAEPRDIPFEIPDPALSYSTDETDDFPAPETNEDQKKEPGKQITFEFD